MMRKLFNIAGPYNQQDHYIIDPTRRLGSEGIEYNISGKRIDVLL